MIWPGKSYLTASFADATSGIASVQAMISSAIRGFEVDDVSEYRSPSVTRKAEGARITATAAKAGTFYPGIVFYDSRGNERIELRVNGVIRGTVVADADDNRERLYFTAEPVVFRGSVGIPQFSLDGQRLLILSGAMFNVFDSVRLIDVSPLYRPREDAPKKLEAKSAPPWLADVASAVSASDPSQDGSLTTLEDVRKKYPGSKAGDAYELVWKRFFPEDTGTYQR